MIHSAQEPITCKYCNKYFQAKIIELFSCTSFWHLKFKSLDFFFFFHDLQIPLVVEITTICISNSFSILLYKLIVLSNIFDYCRVFGGNFLQFWRELDKILAGNWFIDSMTSPRLNNSWLSTKRCTPDHSSVFTVISRMTRPPSCHHISSQNILKKRRRPQQNN